MLPPAESIQFILPAACILLLVLALLNPVYGVIAYFIILNAKLGDMYPALGQIRFELLVAVYVFIAIFISLRGFGNFLPRLTPINSAFWVLFFIGMLSVAFSINPALSWENGGYFLFKVALFYLMIVMTINSTSDIRRLFWAFAIVAAWIAYEPAVNYLTGNVDIQKYGEIGYGRFGAAVGHVALANTLDQSIPITFYLALSTRNRIMRTFLYLILALLFFGVYVTKSRGGFLGLVVIAMGIIFLAKARSKAVLLVLAAGILFFSIAGATYIDHMSTLQHGIHGSRSTTDRYLGLVNGISMMIKRPILGVGVGNFAEARKIYFHYYFYAHNLYGELFGELGLASVAWFYWIYVVLKRSRYLKNRLEPYKDEKIFYYNLLNGIQLGIVVRLILGNFTHGWYIWFWFMMAALVVGMENILLKEEAERQPALQ
jgi:O-antigen ligase